MTKLKYLLWAVLAVTLASSCKKVVNSAPPSQITYLPKMDMKGDAFIDVPCGETFTDPGIVVTESGQTIPHTEDISGSYFGDSVVAGPDLYTIAYKAVNKDGIPGSAFRTVLVEPCKTDSTDLSGLYSMYVLRADGEEYTDLLYGFVVKVGANQYALSDCIGGFYDLGRGYGSDYAAKGAVLTVNGSNITATDGVVPGFDLLAELSNITIDSDGKISFTATNAMYGLEWQVVYTPL